MSDIMTMNRRAMMQRALLLIGASASLSACDFLGGISGDKSGLDKDQLPLLSAIADTLIPANDTPGALGAGVPEKFDKLLANWASPDTKDKLIGVLTAIDNAAKDKSQKPFAELDPAGRTASLAEFDKAALLPGPPPKEKLSAFEAMMAGPPVMNPDYVKLKQLLISLYYTSEVAMTKEIIYEHVPGKWVPSMKATPETRPFAGLGAPY